MFLAGIFSFYISKNYNSFVLSVCCSLQKITIRIHPFKLTAEGSSVSFIFNVVRFLAIKSLSVFIRLIRENQCSIVLKSLLIILFHRNQCAALNNKTTISPPRFFYTKI